MKHFRFIVTILFAALILQSCLQKKPESLMVKSPDSKILLNFSLNDKGEAIYSVMFNNKLLIDSSKLGFDFEHAKSINDSLKIIKSSTDSVNEKWDMVWGEQKIVSNHYNELRVDLQEIKQPNRKMSIVFKVFNDGLGFRYEFPKQGNLDTLKIANENTEFRLIGDPMCWWIPGDWDCYEHVYSTTRFSKINALSDFYHNNLASSTIKENSVSTPVTLKTDDGIYLSFHEANLTNYSGMTLKVDKNINGFISSLVPSERTNYKVIRALPFHTPWRTIQIANKAGDLITSRLILNLNEPNKLGDIPWFKPMKYVGIWWEMHLGKSSWDYASGKHGATTAHAKELIDFAAANNIGGLLVEGWNTGWEHWYGFPDREGIFDFVTPYPDYNLKEVAAYAKEKGVQLIMHHETSAAVNTYNQQMDTAFSLMKSLGLHLVKTGYVGPIIPVGEHHHGQWMVEHYQSVIEKAAKYQIAVDAHEPIKPTGIRRTYPNFVSREGVRGQEYNAWSADGGNRPEHTTIIPFTRMLGGPIDFTPGIFNLKLKPYKDKNQVNTTLAKQLALYVVIYSPIQMAADLIENYKGQAAFQFIRDVAVDWDTTLVLNAEIGDYLTIARKERNGNRWFLGGITDENPRNFTIKFDFLDKDKKYMATIYKDGKDADWDKNPTAIDIEKKEIDSNSSLNLKYAPGGGVAISIVPIQ